MSEIKCAVPDGTVVGGVRSFLKVPNGTGSIVEMNESYKIKARLPELPNTLRLDDSDTKRLISLQPGHISDVSCSRCGSMTRRVSSALTFLPFGDK